MKVSWSVKTNLKLQVKLKVTIERFSTDTTSKGSVF